MVKKTSPWRATDSGLLTVSLNGIQAILRQHGVKVVDRARGASTVGAQAEEAEPTE